MYCVNCGKEIGFNNNFCTRCGCKLDNNINNNVIQNNSGLKTASVVLGVIGIISSITFIFFIYGFMLSIIGLVLAIVVSKKEKNVLGIVLNSIGLVLSIVIICLLIFLVSLANEYDDEIDNYYYNEEYEYDNDYYERFRDIIDVY